MKIFITGIRGFIPSHLANHFAKDKRNKVYGIDNNLHPSSNPLAKNISVYYGDVRYAEDVDKYVKEADIVYHLAAQINVDKSISHPRETLDINFGGTQNVLEACRRYRKTMVFASTSEIYGGHDENITESSPTYAQSPYAVSKLAADKLCGNYHELYGVETYRVRCFNTYGPHQSEDEYGAVIPIFTRNILANRAPMIFGDGTQKRDFINITDVVRAYEMIPKIKELRGEPVNLATGKSISVRQLADMIIKIAGKRMVPIFGMPRPGEVHKLQGNIKLLKSYGFTPQVQFEEGLKEYIKWYQQK